MLCFTYFLYFLILSYVNKVWSSCVSISAVKTVKKRADGSYQRTFLLRRIWAHLGVVQQPLLPIPGIIILCCIRQNVTNESVLPNSLWKYSFLEVFWKEIKLEGNTNFLYEFPEFPTFQNLMFLFPKSFSEFWLNFQLLLQDFSSNYFKTSTIKIVTQVLQFLVNVFWMGFLRVIIQWYLSLEPT